MARRVQDSGRTGWYYRVLEPGYVEAGDQLMLVDRLSPAWTIARLWRALYIATLDFGELAAMSELAHLPESWRKHAAKRLSTRAVEDWTLRLTGEKPGG
jgi:MOSC domain-containing protein YiiM